jgi:hypothetical protein
MPLSARIAALSCATLLAACASSSPLAVNRQPDPSLLEPCVDPELVADADAASDNDIAAERIRVAEAYVACKQKQADLAAFVKGPDKAR